MQPDCGENPCTPNTLIRITGTGWRADEADQPVFFVLEMATFNTAMGTKSPVPRSAAEQFRKVVPCLTSRPVSPLGFSPSPLD